MTIRTKFFRSKDLDEIEKKLNDFLVNNKLQKQDIVKVYYNAVASKSTLVNTVILIYSTRDLVEVNGVFYDEPKEQ